MESKTWSALSAQPLVASQGTQEPFLGLFEDMSCFPYLIFQLCAWFMFLTFWILFAYFPIFTPILDRIRPFDLDSSSSFADSGDSGDTDSRLYDSIYSLPFGEYQAQSPAIWVFWYFLWILLFGPTVSILYLLFYPRLTRSPKLSRSVVGLLLRLSFSIIPLLFPTLTLAITNKSYTFTLFAWCEAVGAYLVLGVLYSIMHTYD